MISIRLRSLFGGLAALSLLTAPIAAYADEAASPSANPSDSRQANQPSQTSQPSYRFFTISSTRSFASPNNISVFSLKNNGFCTPA